MSLPSISFIQQGSAGVGSDVSSSDEASSGPMENHRYQAPHTIPNITSYHNFSPSLHPLHPLANYHKLHEHNIISDRQLPPRNSFDNSPDGEGPLDLVGRDSLNYSDDDQKVSAPVRDGDSAQYSTSKSQQQNLPGSVGDQKRSLPEDNKPDDTDSKILKPPKETYQISSAEKDSEKSTIIEEKHSLVINLKRVDNDKKDDKLKFKTDERLKVKSDLENKMTKINEPNKTNNEHLNKITVSSW